MSKAGDFMDADPDWRIGGRVIECPGTPISSGMRRLSDDEQEEARRQHDAMVRELLPRLDEMDRVRRRGAAEARSAIIG